MVYTIAVFALWPWGRATDRERSGATVVVYTLFPLIFWTKKAEEKTEENGSDTVRATPFCEIPKSWLAIPFHSPVGPECAFHCSDSLVCLPQRLLCVVARLWLLFASAKWQVLWANAKAEKRKLLAADPSKCPRAHEANASPEEQSRGNFKTLPWKRRPPPKRFNRTLQKALSNPPKGSIEPLKRFYRTPKGSIEPPLGPWKGSKEPQWKGLQNHRKGSIEPFASNPPPFSGYPFTTFPTSWGSEMKAEAGTGAASRTRKPRQSAHAESI